MKRELGVLSVLAIMVLAIGCGGGGESAPPPGQGSQPPIVVTEAASSITATSATLNGKVNPNGMATTSFFYYSTDPVLNFSSTTNEAIGSGTSPVSFSTTITGLTPATTYYYRVAAMHAAEGAGGVNMSFTTATPNGLPTVQTLAATSITQNTATINASVIPNGLVTTAHFEWATDNAFINASRTPDQTIGSGAISVAINAPLTGLNASTRYFYRVVATNSAGTSTGAISIFWTIAPNTPPTVQTLNATAITQSSAVLNGSVNANGLSTTIYFLWGTDNTLVSASRTPDQSVGAPTGNIQRNASISGLTASTTYYFQMVATSSAGTSKGTIASFTAAPLAGLPPTVQTMTATSVTATSATLRGNVEPKGLETTAYFEWGTSSTLAGASRTPGQAVASGVTSMVISAPLSGLTAATTYYYRVVATNSAGANQGTIVPFTTSPSTGSLPLVTIGGADSITATSMRLVFGGVSSADSPAVAFYEYSTDPSFVGALKTPDQAVPGFANITATITGLTPATYYYFRLGATNAAGTAYSGTVYGNYGIGGVQTLVPAGWPNAYTVFPNLGEITANSALLEGGVTSTSEPATAYFEWDTDVNFSNASRTPSQIIGPTNYSAFSARLNNLSPATTYYFRAVAENSKGKSMYMIQIFYTLP